MVLSIVPKVENISLNYRTILFFAYIFGKDPKVQKSYTIEDIFESIYKIIRASVKENATLSDKIAYTYSSVLQRCFSETVPKCKLTYGQDSFLTDSLQH